MYRVISTDGFITVYSIDTEEDVNDLPADVGQGSMAILCASADGSGIGRVVYMLDSSGTWVK